MRSTAAAAATATASLLATLCCAGGAGSPDDKGDGRLHEPPATVVAGWSRGGLKSDDRAGSPAPINHTVSQIWQHGEGGCLCIGIPALIHTRDQTVLAFAECRMWKGDGCLPNTPAPPQPAGFNCSGTCIVAKRSADGGKTWSTQHLVTHAGGNVMPVYDSVRGRVVLNFALGHASDPPFIQASAGTYSTIASTDSEAILTDAVWSAPRRIAQYPGGWASQPGPGAAVQLRPGSGPHAGRLVFAGWLHNTGKTCDVVVWISDDGGETYRPSKNGLINGTCETSLSQLGDGRIVLLGNDGGVQDSNNLGKAPCKTNELQHYLSSDGDSWSDVHCDAALVNSDCQAPVLAVNQSIVVANPEGPGVPSHGQYGRTNMVVHVSDTSGSSFQALPITFDTGGGPNKTAAGYSSLTFVDAAKPRTVGLAWETSGPGNTCGGEAGAGSRCRILFSVFDIPPSRTVSKSDDTSGGVRLHSPRLLGSTMSVVGRTDSGNVTLRNNESWGIEASFALSHNSSRFVFPNNWVDYPSWTGSTPLLYSGNGGDAWAQVGSVLCNDNLTRNCGITPVVQSGPDAVRGIWAGKMHPTGTDGENHSADEAARDGSTTRTKFEAWYSYESGPVLEYAATPSGNLEVRTLQRNVTYTGLPHPTHGNCEFNANSYVPGFRGTGMMLAACQAISLPDGTFLTSAIVCWDRQVTLSAYGGVYPSSLVSFRSKTGWDWTFSSIIANASWYMGPPEKPPPFPQDPARPGVHTKGGWINQTIQYGPNENALVVLGDGKTVMSVVRMDANSACGGRRSGVWPPSTSTSYQYYHQAFSTDLGRSFSMPTPMIGAGCVRPRLFLLRPGGLLMSGGRDCVDDTVDIKLWHNADGMGRSWKEISVTGAHNREWTGDPAYRYTARVNGTGTSDIFAETNSYTNLLPLANGSALLLYSRMWPAPGYVDGKPDPAFAGWGGSTGFSMIVSPA